MSNDIVYTFEFIGSDLEVLESNHEGYREVEGQVVDETKKMFTIDTGDDEKRVPKKGNRFKLTIEGRENILKGTKLTTRPENRIKKLG